MNNDLEQFSEERLIELSNINGDINTRFCDADIEALARIALAAKQAKPVEVLQFIINNPEKDGYIEWADCNQDYFNSISIDHRRVLYTTPKPAHTKVNSPKIPDGWNLVPVEPTEEMIDAGLVVTADNGQSEASWLGEIYQSMLRAAAPKSERE